MSIYNKDILLSNEKFLKGNFQLIACAGSGKTEFVSERIAFQIEQGIAKPEEIVAFTFTEKAAEELKFRVRSKIKEILGHQPDIGDMYIGTIHAFDFKILQDFIPKYRGYDMLDDVGRVAFLSTIKSDMDIEYLKNSLESRFVKPWRRNRENWAFSVFINDLDKVIEEGWDVEEVATSDSFKNAYQVYLDKMEEKRFLDFSSIQRIAVDTLKNNPVVLQHVKDQFKFFTVDEYQDVNPIQDKGVVSDDGTTLEIIDFKTGKADNYLMEKLQVQLYAIAAKEALGMDIQTAQVHFLDAAKNERLQIGTTEHALETAREQISYAIGGITKMNFKRDARNDKKCKSCDWKSICPKRNGYKGK